MTMRLIWVLVLLRRHKNLISAPFYCSFLIHIIFNPIFVVKPTIERPIIEVWLLEKGKWVSKVWFALGYTETRHLVRLASNGFIYTRLHEYFLKCGAWIIVGCFIALGFGEKLYYLLYPVWNFPTKKQKSTITHLYWVAAHSCLTLDLSRLSVNSTS